MRVLCAMDGSESALLAGRWVGSLPLTVQDEVIALTVVIPEDGSGGTAAFQRSVSALQSTAAEVRPVLVKGHAADQILRTAAEERADLIVVGSRGLTGLNHLLLGSVAERVARHAGCPVMVARGDQAPRRIVLGTDGSDGADRAIQWLRTFPGATNTEVAVVTVLPFVEDLARARRLQFAAATAQQAVEEWVQGELATAQRLVDSQVEALRSMGVLAVPEVRHGDVAQGLLEAAGSHQADLIVVGAQGLSAIERFFMGSVSERVLRHADCSVAVVR